uniref:WRKY2 n=1 Tax=Gentiana crassa subsp. rigescens TaxID=3097545 RepID=A0A097P6T9_9GENT|nr:WRKY2 [Gentiana rigescens]
MSDSNFYHIENPINYDLNNIVNNCSNCLTSFELCECISALKAQLFDESSNSSLTSSASASSISGMQINNNTCKTGIKKTMKADGLSIALRTRTHLDNLDDGFKWRKYGKKPVKTNPNPSI